MLSFKNLVLRSKDRLNNYPMNAMIHNRILSSQSSWSKREMNYRIGVGATCLLSGYLLGRYHQEEDSERVLPNGLPRTCCEEQRLTKDQEQVPQKLKAIVGSKNVLKGDVTKYTKGARLGHGRALCIVTPTCLEDVVKCIEVIVNSECVVLAQGRNTGLTGGSVPHCKRPTVILNTQHLDKIIPIDNGNRVLCYAGVGIGTLSNTLNKLDRESHSILGSTFLNPTTAAGVAFGSGGTQLRKGPAYTDRALYCKVIERDGKHTVQVVNTLGIHGITDIASLESTSTNSTLTSNTIAQSSDKSYGTRLCNLNSDISRYNGDTSGCECNRSEGKVVILATVHDTFPKPKSSKTYWISFKDYKTACAFRAQVALKNPSHLPSSMEYINRDAFDVIDRSGRIMAHIITFVGPTSSLLTTLWNVKIFIESSLPFANSDTIIDSILHFFNLWFFPALPKHIQKSGKTMDHHVIITIPDYQGDAQSYQVFGQRLQDFQRNNHSPLVVHECKQSEVDALNAFRFVAAIAFRTWCVGEGVQGISVDYALPKNYGEEPPLTKDNSASFVPLKRMRYAHFGCNVIHEDLAYSNEINVHDAKMAFKKAVEVRCGGRLPAEHGHGTEYHAPLEAMQRWKKMDPCNVMNPGVGGLSHGYKYRD